MRGVILWLTVPAVPIHYVADSYGGIDVSKKRIPVSIPEGPLTTMLGLAHTGDVLAIPCCATLPSDDILAVHECLTLYACVLLASHSRIVLSHLHEQITDIEPVEGSTVIPGARSVALYDEHNYAVMYRTHRKCRLLRRRRRDLGDAYFESLTPVGPINATH